MLKVRPALFALGLLLASPVPADVAVSIGIGLPHASIGIHVPAYPRLVAVPGYPVYYAPRLAVNLFFYDGMYWVFENDNWYASYWYDGPWWYVSPAAVPVYILRVPVRYYRKPPPYFRHWHLHSPPRWGDRWGRDWERQRRGWDRWDSRAVPQLAPLPHYQRRYSGNDYPREWERQRELHRELYRYQPREPAVRQHYRERVIRSQPPAQPGRVQDRRQPPPPPGAYQREQREQREWRDQRGRDDRAPDRDARGPREDNGRERGRGRDD